MAGQARGPPAQYVAKVSFPVSFMATRGSPKWFRSITASSQPHVQTGRFLSTLVDLEVEGKTVRAIPRDVQFEPVRDFIVHVDFLRLGKDARIAVDIPVHFKNQEALPGIKKGGVLNIVSHDARVSIARRISFRTRS